MKFLIFGGTGFVGKKLQCYIEEQGGETFTVSRSGRDGSLPIDITNEAEFSRLDFRPDVIVNCASRLPAKGMSSTDPEFLKELFLTNVVGSANIVNWAVKNKIPKIINCSTLVVVKKPWPVPLNEEYFDLPEGFHVGYAMSKLSQEQIMNQGANGSGTELVHLRLSAVYGEGMIQEGIIFTLLNKLIKGEEVFLTDAEKNSVDFIHVRDVCRAIFAISNKPVKDNIINVAGGNKISILQLAETLKEVTGSKSLITNEVSDSSPSESVIDIERMKSVIGEEYSNFLDLREGLSDIAENYKE